MSDVLRIVVADDAVLLRAGITRILETAGWAVTGEVDNADDLLTAVRRDRPDVAVVDIRMPPGHSDEGIVATRAIRAEFGEEVASLVRALTEDAAIRHYAQRKRALRGTIAAAGSPAVDIAIADKIATLRQARLTASPVSDRKLRHYRTTLQLALAAGLATGLCRQLEDLLAVFAPVS